MPAHSAQTKRASTQPAVLNLGTFARTGYSCLSPEQRPQQSLFVVGKKMQLLRKRLNNEQAISPESYSMADSSNQPRCRLSRMAFRRTT